jgi:hypothetical protein
VPPSGFQNRRTFHVAILKFSDKIARYSPSVPGPWGILTENYLTEEETLMRRCLVTLIASLAYISPLTAQQPKVLAPHVPIPQRILNSQELSLPPAKAGSIVGGLWMTNPNLKSSMYLKNVLEVSPITVTPLLYLSNGKQFRLPDVTLQPVGTAVVDINAELQKLGIASYATLSGYVEIQYHWAWVPLCATIRVVDTEHSVIFTYGLRPATMLSQNSASEPSEKTVVKGLWWKQESTVSGFVALSNTTSKAVPAVIVVTDNRGTALGTHGISVSPHGTKIVQLSELQSPPDNEGGIDVSYVGPAGALEVNGGMEDLSVGYSANLRFAQAPSASAKISELNIAELGLMVGAADPMMLFPAGTTFTPYSVLRNMSDAQVTVTPTFWWMEAGMARSAQLKTLTLSPNQSRSLDVMSLVSAAGLKNFNGTVNLVFADKGKEGALLLAAGSVDQSNNYVFEVMPRGIGKSASKSLAHWSTANGDDTMVTVWNPADEAQDFVFRLMFSGGHYLLPMHFAPRATRTLNISEIVQNQLPDAEGNVIPTTVYEGSATLGGTHGDVEHILVAMDAGTYNVRKATCGYSCTYCDGYTSFAMNPGNAGFAVHKTRQYQFIGTYSSGTQYSVGTNWSSSKTAVTTVVSSTGVATGVSPGSANAVAYFSQPVYEGTVCSTSTPTCVPFQSGYPTGGAGVFSVSNVLPSNLVLGAAGILTIYGQGFKTLLSPIAQFASTSGITTGTPTVALDGTTMTVSYQVTCSVLLGTYNLTIGDSVDGGISGTAWPETVILPSAPAPTIKLGGNAISGTQAVVVGQQIALSASVSLPACSSLSSQAWLVASGTAVGGYTPTPSSYSTASVTPLPSNTTSSYTFYWAYAGNPLNITYQYTISGGGGSANSPATTATFNVAGPTGASISATPGIVNVWPAGVAVGGQATNPWLEFGVASGNNIGMLFAASATLPSGNSGAYSWVQLVGANSQKYVTSSGSTSNTAGQGLDNTYPYQNNTSSTNDSPGIELLPSDGEGAESFNATMYLLWTPNAASGCTNGSACTIPVPLGYVSWTFSGDAINTLTNQSSTNTTWIKSCGQGSANAFQTSSPSQSSFGYPAWTNVIHNIP